MISPRHLHGAGVIIQCTSSGSAAALLLARGVPLPSGGSPGSTAESPPPGSRSFDGSIPGPFIILLLFECPQYGC